MITSLPRDRNTCQNMADLKMFVGIGVPYYTKCFHNNYSITL